MFEKIKFVELILGTQNRSVLIQVRFRYLQAKISRNYEIWRCALLPKMTDVCIMELGHWWSRKIPYNDSNSGGSFTHIKNKWFFMFTYMWDLLN